MPKDKSRGNVEDEVWAAISAFEQILEAIPNDRASLEALSHAYEQIGDHTKAQEHAIRLGNLLLEEQDIPSALDLIETLATYADANDEARELVVRIQALAGPEDEEGAEADGSAEADDTPSVSVDSIRSTFNMADELSFAWNLMEAGELSQEEYASVVQDLTEMSANDSMSTVSVLHVMEARGFKNLERVLGHISKECESPIVTLSCFDFPSEVTIILPMDFMVRRGVLVYELMASDALVVVMNPYDQQLRKDIAALAGRRCHFYVALPSDFDQALEKMISIEAEARS